MKTEHAPPRKHAAPHPVPVDSSEGPGIFPPFVYMRLEEQNPYQRNHSRLLTE